MLFCRCGNVFEHVEFLAGLLLYLLSTRINLLVPFLNISHHLVIQIFPLFKFTRILGNLLRTHIYFFLMQPDKLLDVLGRKHLETLLH
jgi:hypothetical protein